MDRLYQDMSNLDSQKPIEYKDFHGYGEYFQTIIQKLLKEKLLLTYVVTAKSKAKQAKDKKKTARNSPDKSQANEVSSDTLSHMERKFEITLIEIQKQIDAAATDDSVPFVRITQEMSPNNVQVGHVDMEMLLGMFYLKGGSGTVNISDFTSWKKMTLIKQVTNMLMI